MTLIFPVNSVNTVEELVSFISTSYTKEVPVNKIPKEGNIAQIILELAASISASPNPTRAAGFPLSVETAKVAVSKLSKSKAVPLGFLGLIIKSNLSPK